MKDRVVVTIESEHWLKRKVFYLERDEAVIFPNDALGARDQDAEALYPKRGQPLDFDFGVVSASCDVATDRRGRMRLRESTPVGEFYSTNRAKVGDQLEIERLGSRTYRVRLIPR